MRGIPSVCARPFLPRSTIFAVPFSPIAFRRYQTLATSPKSDPNTDQLTFWSADPPASPSPTPEDARDFATRVANWPSSSSALLLDFKRNGWSSKTSPASCTLVTERDPKTTRPLTTEEVEAASDEPGWILEPSSGRWGNSGLGSPTGSWTLSTSEFHNDAVASSLLDVLEETGVRLQAYCLSAKACEGLLRRAERRGRTLPEPLRQALLTAIGMQT